MNKNDFEAYISPLLQENGGVEVYLISSRVIEEYLREHRYAPGSLGFRVVKHFFLVEQKLPRGYRILCAGSCRPLRGHDTSFVEAFQCHICQI